MNIDILIYKGLILTPNSHTPYLNPGYLVITEGKIVDLAAGDPPESLLEQAKRTIDARNKLVMPGLINSHTHAAMSIFRGIVDDLPLDDWLKCIFSLEKEFVDEEFVYWGSLLSGIEMIMSGTTCFADGYFYEDSVARACLELGIRAVLAQGVIDFPTPDVPEPSENLKVAENFLKAWMGHSLISPAIFAHAPYSCSSKTIKGAKALTRDYKTLFFIHVAETRWEVEKIKREYGETPISYLYKLNTLDEDTVLVHVNWISRDEIEILKDTGAKVVHNPESNMKLGSGLSPVPDLLKEGIIVGLGTDSCASNNNLDLFQEMDTCAKVHKGWRKDPTVMPAEEVLNMSTYYGAKVLKLEEKIGCLEKGKDADIILVDLNHTHLFPIYNPYSHIVYAMKGTDVNTVIIEGKIIMENRKIISLSIQDVIENVILLSKKIKKWRREWDSNPR